MTNIAVITQGTKEVDFYTKYSFEINKGYCEKHGYAYIQYNRSYLSTEEDRDIGWDRIKMVRNHLDIFDWIMWIDGDAIFYNHDIKIEEKIDDSYNFLVSEGCGKEYEKIDRDIMRSHPQACDERYYTNINTGVFIIRGKCSWSYHLLDYLWSKTEYSRASNTPWRTGVENGALAHTIGENHDVFNSKIKILQQKELNGFEYANPYDYRDFSHDQFIIHMTGLCLADKKFCLETRHKEFRQGMFSGDAKYNRVFMYPSADWPYPTRPYYE